MILTDSIARVSRKLAARGFRKPAVALFRCYPCKQGVTTIRDFDGGLSMNLDRGSYISSAIYWSGQHSRDVRHFVCDYLRPDMVFADIGANIGEITLVAAKRLPLGKVLSFEPSPRLFEQLSRNVALNEFRNVELRNFALYDRCEMASLYLRTDTSHGTLNEGISSLLQTGTIRQEVSVPLRRFDCVAEELGLIRLDLVKIDVEGVELMVLRGGEESLRRFRPVLVVEIDEPYFQLAGYSRQDLFAYLASLDYNVPTSVCSVSDVPEKCDAVCFPRERNVPMKILAPGDPRGSPAREFNDRSCGRNLTQKNCSHDRGARSPGRDPKACPADVGPVLP